MYLLHKIFKLKDVKTIVKYEINYKKLYNNVHVRDFLRC